MTDTILRAVAWTAGGALMAALAGAFLAAPAGAQVDRVDRGGFSVEVTRGIPFDVYSGRFEVDRREILHDLSPVNAPQPQVRFTYRERATTPTEVSGAFRWGIGRSFAFTVRLRRGSSISESFFSGAGGAPLTLERDLSWTGLDVTAAIPLSEWGRWRWTLIGGVDRTWWTLDTGGAGFQALARAATLDQAAPEVVWSDRSWSTLGLILGSELEASLSPSWSVSASLRQRTSRLLGDAFARGQQEDIRRATGEDGAKVTTPGTESDHFATPLSFSLGAAWRPIVRDVPDPAPAVLARRDSPHPPELARDPNLPPDFHEAMATGDTVAAIAALESALERPLPNPTPVKGELGLLLAYTAPEKELDFTQRKRASELLEEALKGDPGNPRYFLALGVVLEKGMMRGDARLAVDRGLSAAEKRPSAISDRELADAFYRRGHALEVRIREFDNLKNVPADQAQLGTVGCQLFGDAFCLNWDRPRRFFDHFQHFPDLSELMEDDRQVMEREYRRAVRIDAGHDGAWRGLLRSLADLGRWDEVAAEAARWLEAEPDNPWAHAFAGLGHVRADEDWERAENRFRAALEGLGDRDRAVFLDLTPLLRTREEEAWARLSPIARDAYRKRFFLAQDPLLLTDPNEREMAHYARVAEAELRFGEPQKGRRGWETDRGDLFIRYGPPETVWQVRRDDRRILSTEGLEGNPTAGSMMGGRWIFWNYDPDEPSFVFEKQLGRTHVTHMASSQSLFMARDLKAESPTAFANPFVDAGPLPLQIARFRSPRGPGVDVEVHALAPLDGLLSSTRGDAGPEPGSPGDPDDPDDPGDPGDPDANPDRDSEELRSPGPDSLHTGFFLHRTSNWQTEAQARGSQTSDDPGVDFRVTGLGPGVYRYSVEVATPDRSAAATDRGQLLVHPASSTGLAMSDLLVARDVVATVPEPGNRRELSVDPIRCLAVPDGGDFWVVFEAYNLGQDDGVARYRIDLGAGGGESGGLLMRFLRGVARPFTGSGEGDSSGLVSYERQVRAQDGRIVDWFQVRLPEDWSGDADLELTLTDLATGATASGTRSLAGEGCAPGT